jgi:hypothetical protein
MYGFHPWLDQVDAIDQALVARQRQVSGAELSRPASNDGFGETLQTVQTLLLKLVRQGDTSLRMQDVTLALLPDTMAEARAGRKASWELGAAALRKSGLSPNQIAKRFEAETEEAKDFAYGAAQEIKKQQDR